MMPIDTEALLDEFKREFMQTYSPTTTATVPIKYRQVNPADNYIVTANQTRTYDLKDIQFTIASNGVTLYDEIHPFTLCYEPEPEKDDCTEILDLLSDT